MRALVSGGNRGIGKEVVRIILEGSPGSTVFIGCRDIAAGEKIAVELEGAHGGRVEAVSLDVASEPSIIAAVASVSASVPHLDLLVNNAGILHEEFSLESAKEMMQVNFEGVVTLTSACLPMLVAAPAGASILSTSSGVGCRTLGLVSDSDRAKLQSPTLEVPGLRSTLLGIINDLGGDEAHPYHSIPTVGYGLSKLGLNCYTCLLAKQYPSLRVNACSPGFTNTGMCANYTGTRVPKDVDLGASVFAKVLFSELGEGKTGTFFKENSKAGTAVEEAHSVVDPWMQ